MGEFDSSNRQVGGRRSEVGYATSDPRPAINASDRELIKKLSVGLIALFLFTAIFHRLDLLYSHKFFDVTGRAQWIWPRHRVAANVPVAFFATRDFDLPKNRYFTRIKIAGDPLYTLYFNGQEIGGRRTSNDVALDVYDVSTLARDGRNRIVVAVRSANGVGGLLASVDITPEYQNLVATGSDWTIVRRWRDDLLLRDPPRSWRSTPMLLGQPPARRWNFLRQRPGKFSPPVHQIVAARQQFRVRTALPVIDIMGGVAVVGSRPTEAVVFDFGPVAGRLRLSNRFEGVTRAVKVRFGNDRVEFQAIEGSVESFVFAAGERTIVDPQERHFRYAMVYGGNTEIEVIY